MNILKALRRIGIPALALGALLASCTEELSSEVIPGSGGGKAGESEVTLKLQVPGAATGNTRAITADAEKKVDDLYILAFKVDPDTGNETFEYYVAAKRLTGVDGNGQSTWTASLKVKEYKQTFVMVANAQNTNSKVNEQIGNLVREGNSKVGLEKMEVLEGLAETLSPNEIENGFDAANHPLTMYGQTEPVKIGLDKTTTLTVALHRIVARVQVRFDGNAAVAAKFSAQEVYLYNFNNRARVIPAFLQETTDTDYEQTATIPDGAELYPKTQDGTETVPTYTVTNNAVENTIYMFEAAQPQAMTDAEMHLKRPCLIVKGVYEGKSCYYRVDFAKHPAKGDVTYMDIVRNHSYNITVTNVSGRGSDTAHEALKSKAANITASVIEWNDNTVGNIEFEGDRVLGIATKEYELMRAGGVQLQKVRATTNLKWTAKLYDVNGDGTANTNSQPDWINFTNKDGVAIQGDSKSLTQQGTDALQDVYFKVDVNKDRPERKAIIRFTDETGRLSVDALVVQNQKMIPVYLNVKSDGLQATEIEFAQAGNQVLTDIEFGPEDVTLSWEIVNGENDAIGFKSVTMDGTDIPIGDMKGEITSVANMENHYLQVRANELQTAKTWETKNAKLQLIALKKSTGEMVVKEIPLFQKKYGLEIDKTEILCGGQEVRIYVKGNMPWNATWSGDGFTAANKAGLIISSNDAGSGTPSETAFSENSYISLKTNAKPLANKNPYEMNLTFTHRNTTTTLDPMKVTIKGGVIEVDGKLYEVYGPVERSFNTKNAAYSADAATNIDGATIMTYGQANALIKADPSATWGICRDSEILHSYRAENAGQTFEFYANSMFERTVYFPAGSAINITEYVSMSLNGPIVQNPVLESQNLLTIANYGLEKYNTHIILECAAPVTFDIKQLGYMKYGKFYARQQNVTWTSLVVIDGKPESAKVPVSVYGDKWNARFIANLSGNAGNQAITVSRDGYTMPLDVDKWKNEKYKTFYFKPLD